MAADDLLVDALLALRDGDRRAAVELAVRARRADAGSVLAEHLAPALADDGPGGSVYDAPAAFRAFIDGGGNVGLYAATTQAIAGVLRDRAPRSLLDVGCGDGRVTRAVVPPSCASVDLVEPSRDLLALAAEGWPAPLVVRAHGHTSAALWDEPGLPERWDVAISTYALHALDEDERARELASLARRAGVLAVAEFDVPAFADRSEAHARYAVAAYERGIAEYGADRDLVAAGFLVPVLIGQFDPTQPRMTHEQPVASWAADLHAAGFASVDVRPLSSYWWAPAQLLVATH